MRNAARVKSLKIKNLIFLVLSELAVNSLEKKERPRKQASGGLFIREERKASQISPQTPQNLFEKNLLCDGTSTGSAGSHCYRLLPNTAVRIIITNFDTIQ